MRIDCDGPGCHKGTLGFSKCVYNLRFINRHHRPEQFIWFTVASRTTILNALAYRRRDSSSENATMSQDGTDADGCRIGMSCSTWRARKMTETPCSATIITTRVVPRLTVLFVPMYPTDWVSNMNRCHLSALLLATVPGNIEGARANPRNNVIVVISSCVIESSLHHAPVRNCFTLVSTSGEEKHSSRYSRRWSWRYTLLAQLSDYQNNSWSWDSSVRDVALHSYFISCGYQLPTTVR